MHTIARVKQAKILPSPKKKLPKPNGRQLVRKSATFEALSQRLLSGRLMPLFDLKVLQEAPQHSVWVYAAVYRIAASLARIKPRIVGRDTDVDAKGPDADRVRKVLQRVNDHQTWYTFAFAAMIHKKLDGEVWIEKARNKLGETNRLYVLNPDGMRPIAGRERLYERFEYDVAGSVVHYSVDDIIPIINYNPRSPWRGLSPTAPVRREINTDLNAQVFLLSLLQNMGRPGGVLQPREGEFVGEEEFKALADEIRLQIQGVKKAGDMLVMPSGFEYKQEGFTLEELKLVELRKWARTGIAASYGASPLMMNDGDASTYNNTENQQKAFWDHEGVPELTHLFDSLNEFWVHTEISDEIEIVPDMRAIAAIIDSEQTRTERASKLFINGQLTMNESREIVGKEPVEGGDVFAIPANLQLVTLEQLAAGDLPKIGAAAAGFGGEQTGAAHAHAEERKETEDNRALREFHALALREAEAKLARKISIALRAQAGRVAQKMRDADSASPELVALTFNVEREAMAMFRDLLPSVAAVIRDASTSALVRLGGEQRTSTIWTAKADASLPPEMFGDFDMGNPRILEYLQRDFFDKIKNVTEATRAEIARLVEEGLDQGESADMIAVRLVKATAFSEMRAQRIAQTEVNGALNLGAKEAFRAAGTALRSWLSTGFGNVRESHSAVEAETKANPIKLDDLFLLIDHERGESAELRWPSDTAAPGWASIRCHCTQVPEQEEQRAYYAHSCKGQLWRLN